MCPHFLNWTFWVSRLLNANSDEERFHTYHMPAVCGAQVPKTANFLLTRTLFQGGASRLQLK